MIPFKVGDKVELAIDKEKFKRRSEDGGCDVLYTGHFYNGHSAVVSGIYNDDPSNDYICFKLEGELESNWFYYDSFKLVETKLSKIEQESQRL